MNTAASTRHPASADINVVLFDVGGVLVQLSGVATILEWLNHKITADEVWRIWLHSPSVRAFETGRIDAEVFAAGVLGELQVDVAPQEFLRLFVEWPTGLYPETLTMLARIPPRYQRALLSNSNSLHWPRVRDEMGLGVAIEHHFVSHLTGKIKPDADAFHHVLESLNCQPAQVLFLDDNSLNVDAARHIGMQSILVRGAREVEKALIEMGVIDAGK